jgi:hypothetical protein
VDHLNERTYQVALFHYTSERHWTLIKQRGVLLTSESNIGSPVPTWKPCGHRLGPDVVWLLDLSELGDVNHGLNGSVFNKREVRIEVDVPGIKWLDWAPAQQMNPNWRKAFINAGGGDEAAGHWYVWPREIANDHWLSVLINGVDEPIESTSST